MTSVRPVLGIVDWGIGGLDLRRRLISVVPSLPLLYWSDTGVTPYGRMSSDVLTERLRTVVRALAGRGCTEVVLACNAASTVLHHLERSEVPVSGVIRAGAEAVPSGAEFVGVVGGARTIRSGAYSRLLRKPGRRIRSRIAQPLSAHIEAGRVGGERFGEDLARIVAPLRGADALVLGCTHYAAASDAFAEMLPGTQLVDPVAGLVGCLAERLSRSTAPSEQPERGVLTTGDPDALRAAAEAAWGIVLLERIVVPVGCMP